MTKTLEPGTVIGILGGGQLGKMLSLSASKLGFKTHIFDPDSRSPAIQVSNCSTIANFDDISALETFASSVDVVTYEFENIPTKALDSIEKSATIFPPRNALSISQDRLLEKQFLTKLGLEVAPYRNIENPSDLRSIGENLKPSILKTRRFGYDGKGQIRISSVNELEDAWNSLGNVLCVLEEQIEFSREVSVIAARGQNCEISAFELGENEHRNGILYSTSVPASLSIREQDEGIQIASSILTGLNYVGVIGVELFVTDGGLLVNEFAPRVHNSGHWTQSVAVTDQFEQHIRAIAGWPLGGTSRTCDVEMINLIGDDVLNWRSFAEDQDSILHLYGKSEVRAGRKMGHVNRIKGIKK